MELKCVMKEDDSIRFFSKVVFHEEKYKAKRNVMEDDYPHHVFHIYPPLVLQNLLPCQIFVEATVCVCVCVHACLFVMHFPLCSVPPKLSLGTDHSEILNLKS